MAAKCFGDSWNFIRKKEFHLPWREKCGRAFPVLRCRGTLIYRKDRRPLPLFAQRPAPLHSSRRQCCGDGLSPHGDAQNSLFAESPLLTMRTCSPLNPPFLSDPEGSLLARLPSGRPRWIVGLAGVPGSGKSTFALRLTEAVNRKAGAEVMQALGMDGFHLTKAELRRRPDAEEALARRGAPWTFNSSALADRLLKVREAAGKEPVGWPDFRHEVGDPVEDRITVLPETRLLLVEGLYLLHLRDGWKGLSEKLDERWFLDTPLETSLKRLALRHQKVWGLSRKEAELRIAANDLPNAEFVLQSRPLAEWLCRSDW